jgi:poly(3-hydroxybutyrate) depolymerase
MKSKNYIAIAILLFSSVAFAQVNKLDSIKSAGLTKGSVIERKYRIYVPKYCIDNPTVGVPLIFNFHGTGSNALQEQQMCGFDKISDTAHFITVYPEGLVQPNSQNKTAWNSLGTVQENKDTDLKFVDNLLDTIKSKYNINMCSVFATGMSIGGYMTNDVGFFLNSRFAAIAPVSGIMLQTHFSAGKTSLSHVTPVMHVHGDNDAVVSYNGGLGQASVDTLVNWWVNYNNCTKPATKTSLPNTCSSDGSTVDNYSYPNGKNKSDVELYRVVNGGHYWPSNLFGCQSTSGSNNDYSASMAIWKFFRPFCLDDLKGLTACTAPSITSQSSGKTICSGTNTTFSVSATGTGLTYQWQVNQGSGFNNIINAAPYSNVTTATLTITGVAAGFDGYKYQCVVSGTCAPTATSISATLVVPTAPTATISGDATICAGTNAFPSVAFTGTSPWTVTKAIDGVNQTPVTAPSTPYTFTASKAGVYTVTSIIDKIGCSGTSSGSAKVKMISAISTSNKTETCNGANTNYVIEFDIAGGDTTTYAYKGTAGSFTTPTHFKSNSIASGIAYADTLKDHYSCGTLPIVSGTKTCGSNTITCNATATISGNATVCAGTSASISVALTGTAPYTFTYAIDGTNKSPITTSLSTYTFTSTGVGVYTITAVTDNSGCTGTMSGSVTITKNTTITTSNKTETCSGSNYVVAFDIAGGDAASYSVAGGAISSSTHFTSNPIASGTSYTFTANDKYACTPLTVVTGSKTCSNTGSCTASASISGSTTICSGTSAIISVALAGTPPYNFIYAIDGTNQSPITTSATTYTFSVAAPGVYTLAGITDATPCNGTASGTATIKVNSAITTSNKTETCSGSNYVVAFDIAGGDAASYSVIGGTISSSTHFTSGSIASSTPYSFTVTDKYACANPPVESGTKTCVAGACNATAAISGGGTVCNGSLTTLSIALTGIAPWNFTVDPIGLNVTNQNTTPYIITSTVAGKYTVSKLTDANCTGTTSGTATVVNCVVTPPVGTGVNESTMLNEISIYPNPTDGIFNISAKNTNFKQLQITILNLVGTEIYNSLEIGISQDFTKLIDLTNVSSGMYYIRLSDGISSKISKLSVQ